MREGEIPFHLLFMGQEVTRGNSNKTANGHCGELATLSQQGEFPFTLSFRLILSFEAPCKICFNMSSIDLLQETQLWSLCNLFSIYSGGKKFSDTESIYEYWIKNHF